MKRPVLTHYMAEPWYCPLPMQSVISGGRIFKVFGDRSSAKPQEPLINKLLCMNAFNGVQLWQRDLSPGFMIHRNTLIATPDTLFVGDDKSCKLIDPASGKVRDEIIVPADKSDGPVWKWMAHENGVLYALVGEKEESDTPLKWERTRGAGWPWWKINNYKFGFGKNLFAFDPKTKKVLWHHREEDPIDGRGMALLKGRLYYFSDGKFLACIDAKTGKVAWKNKEKELLDAVGPTKAAQHPLLGFASSAFIKCTEDAVYLAGPNRPMLVAASSKDGKLLWKKDCSVEGKYPTEGGNVGLIIRPDGVYALGQGHVNAAMSSFKLEPLTGKVLATFPSRDRCTRATGCFDTIFTRGGKGGSTAAFDVTSTEPRMGVISPMRPACQDGVVTAHGYLFWGPWMCRCDMTQLGVISLGPGGKFDYLAKATDADRLQSYETISAATIRQAKNDWPSYRHDNGRSVRIDDSIPDKVKLDWTYTPKGATLPTAPIIVGGHVFVGGLDGVVRALYLQNGKLHWSSYTGGPIRYSPAFAETKDITLADRIIVGSGDGYIYCFHAASGNVRWRFRAAPVERIIPVYGTLSSTWPLGGGILVENGVVYGAAGISNHDGTHVYALDADTGKIKWQQHSSAYKDGDELPTGGVSVQGPMLLHNKAVHFASGNSPPIASYALADGKYTPNESSRGKDLYVRGGKVVGSGYPLYWRPEDDQFISTMELETPAGVLRFGMPQNDPSGISELKLQDKWSNPVFHEIAAIAIAKNAVVVTGLSRNRKEPEKIKAGVCAISLADGKVLWHEPLPAVPTAWGLAVGDSGNRIVVTLMDGRVLGFTK
jgi:outer membrane protein assembly factor BamB